MLSFDNTELAFAYRSTAELKKAQFLFSSIANPVITKVGIALTQFALKLKLPIEGIIKSTLFKQFCGGESMSEAASTAEQIYKFGVSVILDYGVEGKSTEQQFDETINGFIDAIRFAKGKKHIPFISVKVTGFARFDLLAKLDAKQALNETEHAEWIRVKERMDKICAEAAACEVMILIDAEETWIQDPVDALTTEMMRKYNRSRCVVYNTFQMYRHDRLQFLTEEIAYAKTEGFILGAKLVRGAYMEKERKRAAEMNYPSPIQPHKEACDHDYDAGVQLCIENHTHVWLFVGTHNELSCKKAVELMHLHQLASNSNKVYFSQLFGMSDNISFNLAAASYHVSKYLPYGPVHDVVPYLMRRAQENTSVKGQTSRELSLIKKELERRKA